MSGHLRLDVYNATNATYQGTLSAALSSEFVDEYNAPGAGTVTVPVLMHDELKRGTLRSIIRQSGIDRTEFES